MHCGARGNITLSHPLHDGDGGYMLVPMSKGIRLGPVTGRLLAEMMTGETPFTDPSHYSANRFGN